jgi:hypothetical protein
MEGVHMRRFTLLFLAFAFVLAATLAAAAPTTAHALVTLSTTEQRLTTSLGDEYDPSISGNLVSYTSNRAGETETDVFAFDLSAGTEFPVADGPGWQEHSAVSAGRIAYSDLATADVIVYDVASGVRTNLTPMATSSRGKTGATATTRSTPRISRQARYDG